MSNGENASQLTFLRGGGQALLRRITEAAGMPLAVHFVGEGFEGPNLAQAAGCAACRAVAEQPGGAGACAQSRLAAARTALRQQRAIPFVCHMGFACVSAPALPAEKQGFVLTLGPYCPSEAPHALDADVRAGFEQLLGYAPDPLPADISDVHLAPGRSVAALAEWARDTLTGAWRESTPPPEEDAEADVEEPGPRTPPGERAGPGYGPGPLAAAIAARDWKTARRLIESRLSETESGKRARLVVRRARALAIAVEAMEGASRAGRDPTPAWRHMLRYTEAVAAANDDATLAAAAADFIKRLNPPPRGKKPAADTSTRDLKPLADYVTPRLAEGVTLNETAAALGEHPTAITHRLQRRYGLSFSQYVGQLRVNKAKDLLRRTKLGVSDVARRVGIADNSNFAKLFRRYEGVSPQEYRERYGRNQ